MVRPFYDFHEVIYEDNCNAEIKIKHKHIEKEKGWTEEIDIEKGSIKSRYVYEYVPGDISDDIKYKRHVKRSAKFGMYYAIKKLENKNIPWGALTGIRPVSLYRMLDDETNGRAEQILRYDYDVSEPKLSLIKQILKSQEGIYNVDADNAVNLYIGIPFCPTRCLYCSFISFDMSLHAAPLEEYTKTIVKEIQWFNCWRKKYNKKLRSVYVGGGTPTAVGIDYLRQILQAINLDKETEFTVEAGRPDTINDEMLKMMWDRVVRRISINPQTMNDETLKLMKRQHRADDIKRVYELSKKYDFIINMDIILGLYGEDFSMVENTLNELEKFDIDNFTVHTLAIKRSSLLKEKLSDFRPTDPNVVSEMIEMSHKWANKMNMQPYYMYRQKYMSGNLENVGFAKENTQCIYNIDIMDETHNLIALGAGAVSKRMYYDKKRHERFANHKSITHYIKNIDQLLLKKDDLFAYN